MNPYSNTMHFFSQYVFLCLHIVALGFINANSILLVTGETRVTEANGENVVNNVDEERGTDEMIDEEEKGVVDGLISGLEKDELKEPTTHDVPSFMWSLNAIPDPRIDVWECGNHGNSSNICNPDNVLSSQQVATLDALIDALWSNVTGPCSGAEEEEDTTSYHITIVILKRIALQEKDVLSSVANQTVAPQRESEQLSQFTEHLRREKFHDHGQWCGNDVLILLATQHNFIYTATGSASSVVLTNECIDGIYADTKPLFQAQQWMEGLDAMLRAYGDVFHGNHDCSNRVGFYFTTVGLSIFGLLALCCCSLWLRESCTHSPRYQKIKRTLKS